MTPGFEREVRRRAPWYFIVAFLVVCALLFIKIAWGDGLTIPPLFELPEPPPVETVVEEDPLEWLYVSQDNVLLWPVVKDSCRKKKALMQVHAGEKVLVIHRHENGLVEVELDRQDALHTHGCVHGSMLVGEP